LTIEEVDQHGVLDVGEKEPSTSISDVGAES